MPTQPSGEDALMTMTASGRTLECREQGAAMREGSSRAFFIRWVCAYGAFGIPQAAAPIAFALLALPLTGSAEHGAVIVLSMTIAQIIGAVPVTRWGRGRGAVAYLRLLVGIRTLALILTAVLAALRVPLTGLAAAAMVAGFVNGAAFGYLRALLNSLVEPRQLPRALGVAATLNEVTFAAFPVVASALGALSPVLAIAVLAVLGSAPLFLVPSIHNGQAPEATGSTRALLKPEFLVWLFCAVAGAASVSVVEIAAVSLAVRFGLDPAAGFIFALALCLASITGGVWVSIHNRRARNRQVLLFLAATTLGMVLVMGGWSLATTLAGAALVGFCLPWLGTHFSLVLDLLAPPGKRAEAFALLRTATSLGTIIASGTLAIAGMASAFATCAVLVGAATVLVLVHSLSAQRTRPVPRTLVERNPV